MMMLRRLVLIVLLAGGVARSEVASIVPAGQTLDAKFGEQDAAAFSAPARVFEPETWFHFIGGNVAKPGITADLEAIRAAGIEGVQLFHGQFGGAWPGVDPQIKCLSPSWDDAVLHVAEECRRLGLRFTMQNCPGWAMSGGPWITSDKAMRHVVYSRTDVTGGALVDASLAQPQPSRAPWRDYRDIAVIAFPTPTGDTGHALEPTSITSNREDQPWAKCLRGEPKATVHLPDDKQPVWVEVKFDQPVTLRTVELPSVQSMNRHWCYKPGVTVTVAAVMDDGLHEVARHVLPKSNWQGNRPFSLACSDASATAYRITFEHAHEMSLLSMRLFTAARHNNWQAEAAFVLRGLDRAPAPKQAKSAWIDGAKILDITDKMDATGKLHWEAPMGQWTVLRFGHVNTGRRNAPAPPEATGWECDKLSPIGADTHFAGYIGRLCADDGPLGGGLLKGMLMDSWECETQTWTTGMDEQFAQRRGYALRPWMAALAGYVINDPETTTRFLRDWRSVINDMVVENYFGRMAELGHQRGLAVSFETASGDVFPGDILEYYKHADVPMCEFWHPRMEAYVGSFEFKPVEPCVSAARMYGKRRIAAEAFTSYDLSWQEHPGMLKHFADLHLAAGITHLILSTYTHNPRTDFLPPGTAFGASIGTPFLRGQTWWANMPVFTDYLSRCSYLLERGRPVSDVLWYLGDEQDHKPDQDAPFPAGYQYDYCNPDALLHRLSVRDGKLVTPEGIEYRVLWLRQCPRMLPQTLERIVELARDGAVIVGDRPMGLATLSGGDSAQQRFDAAVNELWGDADQAGPHIRKIGKGMMLSGMTLDEALAELKMKPDVEGDGVVWAHRQIDGADWYFIAGATPEAYCGTLRFRSVGTVHLWDPVRGSIDPPSEVQHDGDTTQVTIDLPASGSTFVVFDHGDPAVAQPLARSTTTRPIQVDGPWALSFPAGRGAPQSLTINTLTSWTQMPMSPEGRAFSGTATYTTHVSIKQPKADDQVVLDLGQVSVMAEVWVNDRKVGVVWTPPYRLDITSLIKPGDNTLRVNVTNTWFNRLVYDAGLDEPARKTWTISGPAKDRPLIPAGLLGPVTVQIMSSDQTQ